jgi:hypothetical protein
MPNASVHIVFIHLKEILTITSTYNQRKWHSALDKIVNHKKTFLIHNEGSLE